MRKRYRVSKDIRTIWSIFPKWFRVVLTVEVFVIAIGIGIADYVFNGNIWLTVWLAFSIACFPIGYLIGRTIRERFFNGEEGTKNNG